jgi:hypothetical protein
MHKDIYGFFAAEKVYKDLAIPWKVILVNVDLLLSIELTRLSVA